MTDLVPILAPAACAGLLGLGVYGTAAPASRLWGPVVSRGGGRRAAVALTFDDGPTPGYTDRVLDALRDAGVPAAFFVIGRNADRWPHLVGRMHDEGHVVANHTYDHPHYGVFRRDRFWQRQIERADAAVLRAVGRRPALFRPPMGVKTWHVTRVARRSGHALVTWSRRGYDALPRRRPASVLARLLNPARPGDILMLHDGLEPRAWPRDPSATASLVAPLVEGLRTRGLKIERLDRLLGIEPYASAPRGRNDFTAPLPPATPTAGAPR